MQLIFKFELLRVESIWTNLNPECRFQAPANYLQAVKRKYLPTWFIISAGIRPNRNIRHIIIDISLYNNHRAINYRLHDVCMLVLLEHCPKHQITGDHQKKFDYRFDQDTQMLVWYMLHEIAKITRQLCIDSTKKIMRMICKGSKKDQPDATLRVHKTAQDGHGGHNDRV